jgi:hypothetical protein
VGIDGDLLRAPHYLNLPLIAASQACSTTDLPVRADIALELVGSEAEGLLMETPTATP